MTTDAWTCGHTTALPPTCPICYRELAQRATALAAENEQLRNAGLDLAAKDANDVTQLAIAAKWSAGFLEGLALRLKSLTKHERAAHPHGLSGPLEAAAADCREAAANMRAAIERVTREQSDEQREPKTSG